jgi:hypothetical protein
VAEVNSTIPLMNYRLALTTAARCNSDSTH